MKCRAAVSAVLRLLFKNLDMRAVKELFGFLTRWYASTEGAGLRRAAAQVSVGVHGRAASVQAASARC